MDCPGNNESAGKRISSKIRKGSPWSVEVVAAQIGVGAALPLEVISNHQDAMGNGNDGALSASTERGGRNGKKRALVATARKLAVLLHHLWVSGEVYEPLHNSSRTTLAAAA
jgi:hypothetical protein